ncbi:MFS general substrate transporter-37 [Coleophoma crateriformis]|uniref:MFS general substrate transporter-37 n=1 Tax=Coleophoma crateriformis TaxID=565419 RepID=A0A3D8QLW6_9HELO|nr:MFS general substrate transporter-37 [Coleophoma crateriformis]
MSDLELSRRSSLNNPKSKLGDKGAAPGRLSLGSKDETLNEGVTRVDNDESGDDYPDFMRMVFIVVALILSIFLVSLDMTIVATAIPKITDEFHGLDLVGWYGAAFFLTVGAFQSTWGKAYKYFPLKMSFLVAIFIFELGSLICGVAPTSTALIVGRAIAGLGGAGIGSGAYTIIAFAARPNQRAAFTGLLGASYGIASVVGPLVGGGLCGKGDMEMVLPIGAISAGIVLLFFKTPARAVPEEASWKEKILQMDLPGAFVIMAAVICYVLALQWGGQSKKWSDSSVIGTLVGFVLIVALFVVVEWYQDERAMMVPRLLKDRTIAVGMLFIFFLAGAFFLLLYYLPLYFQAVGGISASSSGIRNLPLILGCTIATILSGGLVSAYGHFVPFLIIGSVLGTIGSGLIYTLGPTSGSSQWIGYQALAGLGLGFALQLPVISAQAVSTPADLSSTTAMILFAQTIGGAFYVSAGQVAFTNVLLKRLTVTAPSISPAAVVATGVTELRNTFLADTIPGIVEAYMDGLKVAYAIAIASVGISIFVALGSKWPWKNLKGVDISGAA